MDDAYKWYIVESTINIQMCLSGFDILRSHTFIFTWYFSLKADCFYAIIIFF